MLFALVAAPTSAGATHQGSVAFTGGAFGTTVQVGALVTSGPTAKVGLGCNAGPGVHRENTVADTNVPNLLGTGTVHTSVDTFADDAMEQVQAMAETQGVDILNGIITADAVKAVSTTTRDADGFHVSAEGSTLANLRVLGLLVDVTPAPNTEIVLPGLGRVVLNEQLIMINSRRATFTVNMVHVVIDTPNLLGIPTGTEIIVSHATSGLETPADRTVDGRAYGTRAAVELLGIPNLVVSGPTALVNMPCKGTNGNVNTNATAGVNIPGVLFSGTVTNTAQGDVVGGTAYANTSSNVEGLNLLSGLVTATVIRAHASASNDGTTTTLSDAGSEFVELSVQGFPDIGVDVAPNTRLNIAGLGILWLHRVIEKPGSIEVRMVELIVSEENDLGLAVGLRVQVAVASASVH